MDGMKVLIDIIREKEGKCVYVVVVRICITTTYTLTQMSVSLLREIGLDSKSELVIIFSPLISFQPYHI